MHGREEKDRCKEGRRQKEDRYQEEDRRKEEEVAVLSFDPLLDGSAKQNRRAVFFCPSWAYAIESFWRFPKS